MMREEKITTKIRQISHDYNERTLCVPLHTQNKSYTHFLFPSYWGISHTTNLLSSVRKWERFGEFEYKVGAISLLEMILGRGVLEDFESKTLDFFPKQTFWFFFWSTLSWGKFWFSDATTERIFLNQNFELLAFLFKHMMKFTSFSVSSSISLQIFFKS